MSMIEVVLILQPKSQGAIKRYVRSPYHSKHGQHRILEHQTHANTNQ